MKTRKTKMLVSKWVLSAAIAVASSSVFAMDTDGDGINDDKDNCVEVSNADQADANLNGYGDVCDDGTNFGPSGLGCAGLPEVMAGLDQCRSFTSCIDATDERYIRVTQINNYLYNASLAEMEAVWKDAGDADSNPSANRKLNDPWGGADIWNGQTLNRLYDDHNGDGKITFNPRYKSRSKGKLFALGPDIVPQITPSFFFDPFRNNYTRDLPPGTDSILHSLWNGKTLDVAEKFSSLDPMTQQLFYTACGKPPSSPNTPMLTNHGVLELLTCFNGQLYEAGPTIPKIKQGPWWDRKTYQSIDNQYGVIAIFPDGGVNQILRLALFNLGWNYYWDEFRYLESDYLMGRTSTDGRYGLLKYRKNSGVIAMDGNMERYCPGTNYPGHIGQLAP